MSKTQMLINYVPGEECRIAIVEDDRLEELYQERASAESHVGSIYKGRVVNVEAAIQAAFIDFGLERNGFLHISDLHPRYFPGKEREEFERVGDKTPRHERPPIQKCLRRGQEVLVQVLKEGIGTKGPTLTSYLSIPGRFLVMMPHMEKLGVSRKVEDDEARRESRKILNELNPPEGFGFIIRTAGIGRTKTELKRDLAYLVRLWKAIESRMKSTPRVGELYAESDLIIRTIRDVLTSDVSRIIVDDPIAAKRAQDFLSIAMPRSSTKVMLYQDGVPLFHRFDLERQIDLINARTVSLPSGGSLVIDSTEAMVAIDVNSGKSRDARDAETNAYQTDLEAVEEIARQLRLRDLGGVIVMDLIDMRSPKHRKDVETKFRNLLKKDRARTRVGTISQFGLLEMTRQRMRPSLKKSIYIECPQCAGAGSVKSPESVVLDVMRKLAVVLNDRRVERVELTISPDVAFQLLNRKRGHLVTLEQRHHKPVMVRVRDGGSIDFLQLVGIDGRGGVIEYETLAEGDRRGVDDASLVEVTSDYQPEDELDSDPIDSPEQPADDSAVTPTTEPEPSGEEAGAQPSDGEPRRKRRRRRRRRGRGGQDDAGDPGSTIGDQPRNGQPDANADVQGASSAEGGMSPSTAATDAAQDVDHAQAQPAAADSNGQGGASSQPDNGGGRRKRRRRRRRGRGGNGGDQPSQPSNGQPSAGQGHPGSTPRPAPSSGYANRVIPQPPRDEADPA